MNYRIVNSINEGRPDMRAAFAKFGIADYCNALPPRSRKRCVQVFVMNTGEVVLADSRVVAAACGGCA